MIFLCGGGVGGGGVGPHGYLRVLSKLIKSYDKL